MSLSQACGARSLASTRILQYNGLWAPSSPSPARPSGRTGAAALPLATRHKEVAVEILADGQGELIGWRDPDENRQWILEHKSRELRDKRMTVREAVEQFVHDGDYIATGGFGHVRVPMALIYEIVRQGKRDLAMAGKTAVHDIDILIGAGCVTRVEVAYAFGHELRGLSPAGRRAVESGQCRVVAEISNGGYQWRFLAGMMGIPFIPSRNMLGTDTFARSACKMARDPWSGKPICLIPAAYPDVAMFHVPRCDRYGNAQIDGIIVEDFELARAARRVLVTAEEIVDEEVVRAEPWRTVIPFYLVDAVCEVPYGAHPTQMPYLYFFDEEHIGRWLRLSRTAEGTREYFREFVFETHDFSEYLERVGGVRKLTSLRRIERLQESMQAPWLEG
ncbi:MAG: CoA transferase subunit A [Anaerolineae bacterium]|nr:CoA transferase subunit A [Anaerolineae bacterium]